MSRQNAQYLTIQMEDGTELLIQSTDVPENCNPEHSDLGVEVASPRRSLRKEVQFNELLDKTISQVSKFAKGAKDALLEAIAPDEMEPDEIELEFNVGFSAEVKPIIVSSVVSTGLTIHLKWTNEAQKAKAK